MATNKDVSTRGRVLLVLILFSLGLAGTCFWVFLQFFREDKLASIKEADAVRVNALAGDAQAYIDRIAERLKPWPDQGEQDPSWAKRLLDSEPDLVRLALYQPTGNVSHWQKVQSAGPEADMQVPFAKALARGAWAQAAKLDDRPGLRLAVALTGKPGAVNDVPRDFVAVADIRADRWLSLLARDRGAPATYTLLADSDGKAVIAGGLTDIESLPILSSALSSPSRLGSLAFEWKGSQWLGTSSSVGPGGKATLTAVSQTELEAALKQTRKFAEKAGLFGLLGVCAAILMSSWFAVGGVRGAHVPQELGEEFAHLLSSIRQRIDQIHGEIAAPQSKAEAERGITECKEKLESLSHQAAWAAEIFEKMRRI
jgi:hypothetical protein